jgi:transglutaminase-like putative cysteine protease
MANHRRTIAAAAATILASISLYPVFIGTAWFWAGAGAVLAVAGAATLTRLRRLPVVVSVIGTLAGLLLYLNLVFSNGRSWGHLLPTPTSLRLLWDLAGTGFHDSAKYAPPVPALSGMVLLAAGGIGLTALLTDLIAVRLGSAALAGLPLLLLFTEPFTLSISRDALGTTIAFCAATAGYLWLLSSEGRDRIRAWEHTNPDPRTMPDTTAVAAAGRRVGAVSMVVALCVPLIIPGLHVTRLFGQGQPGIGGHGPGAAGAAGFPDPNTQMSNELHTTQPRVEFSYTTTAANPQYFQVYVLDNLTATDGWKIFGQAPLLVPVNPDQPLTVPGLAAAVSGSYAKVTTHVTLSGSVPQDQYDALPVPYPATGVTAPGRLQTDLPSLMVFDNGQRLAGLSYSVRSLDAAPVATDLDNAAAPPSAITSYYTQVPASYNALRGLAQSVVKTAGAKTAFQDAVALQQWLSAGGGFRYTLNAPTVISESGLANFLEHTKRGYCQQFSFAMATLARLLGIPARVAIGFTAGTPEAGNQWLVTTHDAHAWPELYFQGFGWLRFEPTPAGNAPGQGTATTPVYTLSTSGTLPGSSSGVQQRSSSASSGAAANRNQALENRQGFLSGGAAGGAAARGGAGVNPWEVLGFCVLGLAVIAAGAPGGVRLLVRQRRWRARTDDARAHAAWRELRDDLVDYRVGYLPSQSPRTVAARTASTLELAPPAAAALSRIAMAEERARYAARADSGAGLRADSAVIRRAVAAAVPRWTRWRARLLPSSVLSPAQIAVLQATDIFGKLNPERFAKARLSRAENLLQVPFLPSAPALVQALHHRAAVATPAAALMPPLALARLPAPGHSERDAGHVPPAVQRPDAADQHDDEPAYREPDHRQDDTRRYHARADPETGGCLNHPAPVVHAGIAGPHKPAQPPILPVERLLDLLELALLMLRERHDTPPMEPGGWGDFHLTYVPGSFPRIRVSALPLEGDFASSRLASSTWPAPPASPAASSEPAGSAGTSLAGRTASLPNRRAILSIARSASRQPTGRSSNASCRAAAATGRRPAARTPTSRSRARGSSPDPSYSATAVV